MRNEETAVAAIAYGGFCPVSLAIRKAPADGVILYAGSLFHLAAEHVRGFFWLASPLSPLRLRLRGKSVWMCFTSPETVSQVALGEGGSICICMHWGSTAPLRTVLLPRHTPKQSSVRRRLETWDQGCLRVLIGSTAAMFQGRVELGRSLVQQSRTPRSSNTRPVLPLPLPSPIAHHLLPRFG